MRLGIDFFSSVLGLVRLGWVRRFSAEERVGGKAISILPILEFSKIRFRVIILASDYALISLCLYMR